MTTDALVRAIADIDERLANSKRTMPKHTVQAYVDSRRDMLQELGSRQLTLVTEAVKRADAS